MMHNQQEDKIQVLSILPQTLQISGGKCFCKPLRFVVTSIFVDIFKVQKTEVDEEKKNLPSKVVTFIQYRPLTFMISKLNTAVS